MIGPNWWLKATLEQVVILPLFLRHQIDNKYSKLEVLKNLKLGPACFILVAFPWSIFLVQILIMYVLFKVYQDGINNIRVGYILRHLAYPTLSALMLILTVPYLFANGFLPMIGKWMHYCYSSIVKNKFHTKGNCTVKHSYYLELFLICCWFSGFIFLEIWLLIPIWLSIITTANLWCPILGTSVFPTGIKSTNGLTSHALTAQSS